jgi:hypothetical protein
LTSLLLIKQGAEKRVEKSQALLYYDGTRVVGAEGYPTSSHHHIGIQSSAARQFSVPQDVEFIDCGFGTVYALCFVREDDFDDPGHADNNNSLGVGS